MSLRSLLRVRLLLSLVVALLQLSVVPVSARAAVDNLDTANGTVMHTSNTYAIFWLPMGYHFESANDSQGPNASDTTYETLTQQYLQDVGGSTHYTILTQYPDGQGNAPANSSTFVTSVVDTTPYPAAGTQTQPLTDAQIQTELSSVMAAHQWTASPTTLFLVYTAYGIQSCLDSSNSQCSWNEYCAYHSWSGSSSQPTIYAVIPAAGENNGTCLANDGSGVAYAPNNDPAADSAVALTSKGLFAAVSDPEGNGWSDSSGAEIGGKCDWTYGTVQSNGSNLTLNGHSYIVPEEWSNSDQACVLSPSWSKTVPLAQGWSLIDIPAQNTGVTSMASLVTALDASNELGANAVQVVATYSNGRFSLYVPGYSSDQSLHPTQGIFVDSQTAGTWSLSSPTYNTSQSVTLQAGWNLVAAPYPAAGLSSSAILSETAGCGVSEVATYSGGAYQVYTPGGSTGTVASTQGMWLLCSQSATWTPS